MPQHLLNSHEDPGGLDVFCGETRGICGAFNRGVCQSGDKRDRGQGNQGGKPFLAQKIGRTPYSASVIGSFSSHVAPWNWVAVGPGTG